VDFGIDLTGNGGVYVCESGVCTGSLGTYANGDVYRVAIEGGRVKYRKNGVLIYSSTRIPTYALLVDCALDTLNGPLNNVMISRSQQSAGAQQMLLFTNTDSSFAWVAGAAAQFDGSSSSELNGAMASYNAWELIITGEARKRLLRTPTGRWALIDP
jgi:hypothetical protein